MGSMLKKRELLRVPVEVIARENGFLEPDDHLGISRDTLNARTREVERNSSHSLAPTYVVE